MRFKDVEIGFWFIVKNTPPALTPTMPRTVWMKATKSHARAHGRIIANEFSQEAEVIPLDLPEETEDNE